MKLKIKWSACKRIFLSCLFLACLSSPSGLVAQIITDGDGSINLEYNPGGVTATLIRSNTLNVQSGLWPALDCGAFPWGKNCRWRFLGNTHSGCLKGSGATQISEDLIRNEKGQIITGWRGQLFLINAVNNNSLPRTYLLSYDQLAQWKYLCVNIISAIIGLPGNEEYTMSLFDLGDIEKPSQCSISNDKIILDHRSLSPKDVNGSSVSVPVFINCNGKATVLLKTIESSNTGSGLPLGGGIYSKITINGADAINGVRLNVDQTGLIAPNLGSRLTSQGAAAGGSFSGSAVLSLDVL
ncbi:MrpH family fimbial adhesin [Serratia sp. IR-2025]|uniref:MrpH family fimbial adhesin n=1 Tax=Serratia marcescens TaxID=615 RepID=UPI00387A6AFC